MLGSLQSRHVVGHRIDYLQQHCIEEHRQIGSKTLAGRLEYSPTRIFMLDTCFTSNTYSIHFTPAVPLLFPIIYVFEFDQVISYWLSVR